MEEKALPERANEMERLYAIAPVGLCYFDTDLRFLHINEWLARINSLSVKAHLGKTIDEVLKDVAASVVPQLHHVLETGKPLVEGEVKAESPAHPGAPRHYMYNFYPDKRKDGTVVGVSCVVQDITAKKEAELELAKRNKRFEYLAQYDALTGLGNRSLFLKQLEHLIAIAGRKEEKVALLTMDIDGFKKINDRLGHAAGDAVLREFGARLSQALRQTDQKYRIGGDEFAVLLEPRRASLDGVLAEAEKIARHLAAPMKIKGHGCSIGVSIGVAVFPQHGKNPNILLRKADAAMYEAKKTRQAVARASELDATDVFERLNSVI